MIDNKYNDVNATNEEVEEFLSLSADTVEEQVVVEDDEPVMAIEIDEEEWAQMQAQLLPPADDVKEEAVEEVEAPVEETEETVEEAPAVEEVEETVEEDVEEKDYIEAVPYQPVPLEFEEEEIVAEEVEEAPVAAAEFPANKNKLGDEFIDTLTEEERRQFADIFFMKSQGVMDGVPDYLPGKDNSLFFRKVFLYLGKYRAMIPDGLLGKMYDYYTNN